MNENLIFSLVVINFLGVRAVIGAVTGKFSFKKIVFYGIEVIFAVVLAATLNLLLKNFYHYSLRFIAIPMLTLFSGMVAGKVFSTVREHVSLIYYNTAVCGTILILEKYELRFLENILQCIVAGVGFLLTLVVVAAIHEKIEDKDIPCALKGEPVILIILGIISLIIYGIR